MSIRIAGELVSLAIQEERERCAQIAENPGFIQAQDTEWDEGVNFAKRFIAAAIRASADAPADPASPDELTDPFQHQAS